MTKAELKRLVRRYSKLSHQIYLVSEKLTPAAPTEAKKIQHCVEDLDRVGSRLMDMVDQ